ncbi:MAG: carboxypeptidase regulatory-like domain-containing protein [Deltaproteobacteria bacterium]|nr:carboxypeptidase regulatory-like domain-containing protein [Deltaproteobacteria bacterium]
MNTFNGVVFGVVRDESLSPVRGAIVYIVSGTGSWRDIAALSNERGEYRLSVMDPGSYELLVTHVDFPSARLCVEIGEEAIQADIILYKA